MKPYPDNTVTRVSDNWRTVNWKQSQVPSDKSWTGHTLFPLKNKTPPTRKIAGKQPPAAQKSTDFEFTKEDLKPGAKITIQPPSQLRTEAQGKRKADGHPDGS